MSHDHSAADALFDRVLSATLFSFRTNRRIFRGMIRFQDNDRWQSIFSTMLQNSRWVLSEEEIDRYVVLSFDYIVDYLSKRGESLAAPLDPIGDENLGMSKRIRRMAMKEGKLNYPNVLVEMADNFFPLPAAPYEHLKAAGEAPTAGLNGGEH
jgi:hypothetical protein